MNPSSPLLSEEEELSMDMAMRRVTSNLSAAARGLDVQDLLEHNTTAESFVLVVSNNSAFAPVTRSDDGKYSNRTLKVSKTNSCGSYCDRASPVSPTPQHLANNNSLPPSSLLIENTRKHPLHESTTANTSNLVTRLTLGLEVVTRDSSKVLEHQQDNNNNMTAPSDKSCCCNPAPKDGVDEEKTSIEDANKRSSTGSLTTLKNQVNNNNQDQKDASINSNHHSYNSESNRKHNHQRRVSLSCIASISEERESADSITSEQEQQPSPKKSLTEPCEPVSNSGLDNKEGHLIVHEGDTFKIPNTSFAYVDENKKNALELLSPNAIAGVTEFKVLGLLGKGTFAQVFQCANIETGENLAIKVVKNNPAYTKQAKVEIEIFTHLWKKSLASSNKTNACCPWVNLECHFIYKQHLCLVFELLGCNLFDVLRDRQFCGLPLTEVKSIVRQSLVGIKRLADLGVVHCDVKPENIVLTQPKSGTTNAASYKLAPIKIIDFGSAAFEGNTTHSYIQSRFYRSPEVLIGVPYDSAIDVWSLGCVAAELFLGLPILPGKSEHDQLGRIAAMIGPLPEKLVERGSKTSKFFVKTAPLSPTKATDRIFPSKKIIPLDKSVPSTNQSNLRLKTWEEFSLTLPEKQRAEYLQAQNTNRYFKRKKIEDIVMLHGRGSSKKSRGELISLQWFIHLLKGMLDPDPWKRWTAQQALKHPFFTDDTTITEDQNIFDLSQFTWTPPWDPSICRRQLLFHEKTRNIKTSKILSKQVTIPEAHIGTKPSMLKPISPLRRTFSQSRTISEQYSDESVSSSSQNQNANISSPPPSTNISSAFECPVKPHAANVAVHPATFNPAFAYSPGHMSSTASYSGTNTVHLSPYHYSVAVNNAVNTGHFVNGNYPPIFYANGSGGSNLPIYNIDGQGSFDGIPAHCGSLPLYFAARASFTPQHFNDGSNHYPIQGELGYALTRPGVVPGSSNIDHFSQQQVSLQHGQPYYAFGTSPSAMASASSYNTHGYPSPNVNMLYYNSPTTSPNMQGSTPPRFLKRSESGIAFSGLAYNNASSAMRPPRSQSFSYQADISPQVEGDHREIDIPSSQNARNNLPQPRNAPRSSSVTSLLAQQLAEHDNGATQMQMQFQQQPQQQQATVSSEPFESLEQNLEERIERSRRAASYHAYQTGAPAFYSPGQIPSAPFGPMYQMLDPNYSGGVANSFGQYGSGSTLYYNYHQMVGHSSAGNAGSLGSNYEGSTPSGVASSLNHLAYAPPSPDHYNSDLMPPLIHGQQTNSASRKQQRQSQSGMQRR